MQQRLNHEYDYIHILYMDPSVCRCSLEYLQGVEVMVFQNTLSKRCHFHAVTSDRIPADQRIPVFMNIIHKRWTATSPEPLGARALIDVCTVAPEKTSANIPFVKASFTADFRTIDVFTTLIGKTRDLISSPLTIVNSYRVDLRKYDVLSIVRTVQEDS